MPDEKVDFNTVRASVIQLAQLLMSDDRSVNDATKLLTDMFKGTPVSQVTESPAMIETLQVALSSLEEIKERYSV